LDDLANSKVWPLAAVMAWGRTNKLKHVPLASTRAIVKEMGFI
jgi:hypothetical protein